MSAYTLLGAGEFETWHTGLDRELLDGRDGRVLVFATAAAPEGDAIYDEWVAKGIAHYRDLGVEVEAPALKTPKDASDPGIVGALDDAAMVFFSGGNPSYVATVLAGSPFWAALQARIADGRTAYGGCSAGVACLSDPTFDTETEDFEKVWAPGLGYCPKVLFAPHWDIVDDWIPGARAFITAATPDDGTLVAIDERTAVTGDGTQWRVDGMGGVYLHRDGRWFAEHRAGDAFTLAIREG